MIIFYIMIKNNKLPCNNVSTETYTGKEQSPKRFGLSAEGFDLNFEKEGYDGKIWTVQIKNNRKVWVRKNVMTLITHEEPLITSESIPVNESVVHQTPPQIEEEEQKEEVVSSTEPIIEKKKTDYNIFTKYYLDKLKKEDINKTAHKILFQQTIQEWTRLKNNPNELKILMEQLKNK
jgi:hypothetical protein